MSNNKKLTTINLANGNSKVIKRLSYKTTKNNKLRNIFAITAIALTTLLFTTLFTLGMGVVESIEQQTMRQVGSSSHGNFKYLTIEEFDKLKTHPLIKDIGFSVVVNIAENSKLIKRQTEIRYATDNTAKWGYSYPTTGKMPEAENEIVTDTIVLDMLGVEHKVGETVTLEYNIGDEKISTDFILSGFWEGDTINSASQAYVSKTFIEKNLAGIDQIQQKETGGITGLLFADIMFKDSSNIEKNVKKVIEDSGFNENEITFGTNWAYMSSDLGSIEPSTFLFGIIIIILIVLTGYLIIYNIFQISVIKDIRFYGLLKTIGTTPKQIKELVRNQSILLSIIGIPIGLIGGYIIGVVLLPTLMAILAFKTSYISVSPIIFIGSTIFAIITISISCRKPSKIAAMVSPIEAIRYTGVDINYKKNKKNSVDGGKLHKMAFSNLFRNKKKTFIVVISMSLSIILLNAVYSMTKSFDMDKYLSTSISSDFVLAHAKYFRYQFKTAEELPSQALIDAINNLDGIEQTSKIYFEEKAINLDKTATQNFYNKYNDEFMSKQKGMFETMYSQMIKDFELTKALKFQIYGLNEFSFSKLKPLDEKIDIEKFMTGDYAIVDASSESVTNESGNLYNVGDKITIGLGDGKEKTYEIMAKASIPFSMGTRFGTTGDTIYLPEKEFIEQMENPLFCNYMFDVKDENIDEIETFLEDYTTNVEANMKYESKKSYIKEFEQLVSTFVIIGGALSFIIGFVGILNFINSMLTNIISRKQEFAMLQSIGMTNSQLNKMLIFEGLYYSMFTIITIFTVGLGISYMAVQVVAGQMWFFTYHATVFPMIIATPILIIISMIVPYFAYKSSNKQTIVEKLRETE